MIIRVANKRQLKNFVEFPRQLYSDDPHWVTPMLGADMGSFELRRNNALTNLKYELYLFEKDGIILGRVGAFLCSDYNLLHQKKVVFFGLFEAINQQEVADGLLMAVEEFALNNNMNQVIGPVDFTPNYTMGLLVDGFARPSLMTPYNKAYYKSLVEKAGYDKEIDLYAYVHNRQQGVPERLNNAAPLLKKRYPNIFIRSLKKGNNKDQWAMQKVYNEAFRKNWGFLPMSEAEIANLRSYVLKRGEPELCYVAYDLKRPVGMLIALPNPGVKGELRLSVLGVVPDYRGKGVEARLAVRFLQDAFYLRDYQKIEYSLILENNEPMNRYVVKESGCEVSKTYRVFSKQLPDTYLSDSDLPG